MNKSEKEIFGRLIPDMEEFMFNLDSINSSEINLVKVKKRWILGS